MARSLSLPLRVGKMGIRAYDLERGNVDLFLQLRDEGDGPCIVKPEDVSPNGFERLPFGAGR